MKISCKQCIHVRAGGAGGGAGRFRFVALRSCDVACNKRAWHCIRTHNAEIIIRVHRLGVSGDIGEGPIQSDSVAREGRGCRRSC